MFSAILPKFREIQPNNGAAFKNVTMARKIAWVVVFALAMGYLEAAVVIDLRELYDPEGFRFPLRALSSRDLVVELWREGATLVMLCGLAAIAGRTGVQRLAFFLLAFGVWDLTYYLFLKIFLGWPAHAGEWDILFLLPLPWTGPVLAPVLVAATMILLAARIFRLEKRPARSLRRGAWIWCAAGAMLIVASFCWDPAMHLSGFLPGSPAPYRPSAYPWWLFAIGEVLVLTGIFRWGKRPTAQVPDPGASAS